MDVQPSQGSEARLSALLDTWAEVEWVTRISADNLMGVVRPKALDSWTVFAFVKACEEWPEILAVHLHTHDATRLAEELVSQQG